jgi:hypothetical protein
MPLIIKPECRHCGTAIEPMHPVDPIVLEWTHTGLSIYCPGSARHTVAEPVITLERRTTN